MAQINVNTSTSNLIADGGVLLNTEYDSTDVMFTKVLDNHVNRRDKTSFYCYSSQAGTWIIYDVDEEDQGTQIILIPVTADTLSIYTHNHVSYLTVCTFQPSAATPGIVKIRGYTAGWGARS